MRSPIDSAADRAADRAAATARSFEQPGWRRSYARLLLLGDVVVLGIAIAIAQLVRFGADSDVTATGIDLTYRALGGVIAVVWFASLNVFRTRSHRLLGNGADEYRRVVRATWAAFALLAMVSVAVKVEVSRGYVAVAFPVGMVGLIVWRKVARSLLHKRRAAGHGLSRVLVIGGVDSASRIASYLADKPSSGYVVAGVWIPDVTVVPDADAARFEVPVMAFGHGLIDLVAEVRAAAVMVTDTEHLGPERLRELTWQLSGTGVELMLSPNVLDVDGARVHLHDVEGMPMLHVDEPQYGEASRLAKSLFDRTGALLILLGISPVMIALAMIVRLSSVGPVFYLQERIGRDGEPFRMIKFRSMRVGADTQLQALVEAEGRTLAELPKLEKDPRVTPVGAVMRRYSLDELPQLFNVLRGDMSLVGPRPQRHFEVAGYDHVAERRLTVRPGMTGLWQVSGRSDLSYDESIRLDVHYVENWSMTSDLIILWKTLRAVVRSDGAY